MTTAIETPTATIEPTDDALIAKAKGLNKAMERHLRRGIEAFYQLGETLVALKKRTHLHADGRWAVILKEIGISTTTDNHARRFALSCNFADLGLFKNKTDALRKLGILATPEEVKKEPADKSTKLGLLSDEEHERKDGDVGSGCKEVTPGEENGNRGREHGAEADGAKPRIVEGDNHIPKPGADKDLLALSRIAAMLEELANGGLVPTADDLAQLDLIAAAVSRLKEVALVAAA